MVMIKVDFVLELQLCRNHIVHVVCSVCTVCVETV